MWHKSLPGWLLLGISEGVFNVNLLRPYQLADHFATFCAACAAASAPVPETASEGALEADSPTANSDQGGGIGLDPVFQIWSNLWNVDLTGQQHLYYNMTQASDAVTSHAAVTSHTAAPL